ncbi:MAG: glutathione S-transferase family protein [Pseudomonadota bacterium]
MPELTLHHAIDARSFRSLWLLYEIGTPFSLVERPFDKSLRQPEYLAIHPLGRVPALQDGDLTLFETGAITEYLCETYAPQLGRAPGHRERVAWLQWLHYAETLAVHIAALTQQHIVIYDDKDRSPLLMVLEAKRLLKALGVLEQALQGQTYLLPSGFSGVDCNMGYGVSVARRFVPLDDLPNVARYCETLCARPAFQRACPAPDAKRIYRKGFYPMPTQGG